MTPKETRKPYLDFYKEHKISPVPNHGLTARLINSRRSLYGHLNISKNSIRDRDVLEFGPGNGTNSLYTMSLKPRSYRLVDANPTGLKNCRANFEKSFPNENWELHDSRIELYSDRKTYDLVICEGFIPNQIEPISMAKHCASFVAPGGLLIVSCHDPVSLISENLRAFIGTLLISPRDTFETRVRKLSRFFIKDLKALGTNTRNIEDWVIDNILNSEFWKLAPLFSMEEAVQTLQENFVVFGSSPAFIVDWEWYKSIEEFETHANTRFIESYRSNIHNLLDTRNWSEPVDFPKNKEILELCCELRETIAKTSEQNPAAQNNLLLKQVITLSSKLACVVKTQSATTAASLSDLICGLEKYQKTGEIKEHYFTEFRQWWGRGMQYMTFEKI